MVFEHVSGALKAVLSSPPSKSDKTLAPAWVNVLGDAMLAQSATDPDAGAEGVGKVWKAVWPFLESSESSVRKAAAECLGSVARCFTPTFIGLALCETGQNEANSSLNKIISQVTEGVDSLPLARSMTELLDVISSLIYSLRHRVNRTSPSATESLLLPLIQKVGDLRTQKGFEYKEAVDETLATAMRVVGPEVLLRVLPLNLEPSDRYDLYFFINFLAHCPTEEQEVSTPERFFFRYCHIRTHLP